MIDKRQVAALLAKGVSTSHVAATVGCEDSYISQLLHDPEVLEFMQAEKEAVSAKDAAFDEMLMETEEQALELIKQRLPFANMQTALQTFRTLNAAHKRKEARIGPAPSTVVQVNLTLPASAHVHYVTNARQEIIEVEGRTMLSATPQSIEALVAARLADKGDKVIPKVTALEQAAIKLEGLTPLPSRAPRKSPISLSVENL